MKKMKNLKPIDKNDVYWLKQSLITINNLFYDIETLKDKILNDVSRLNESIMEDNEAILTLLYTIGVDCKDFTRFQGFAYDLNELDRTLAINKSALGDYINSYNHQIRLHKKD